MEPLKVLEELERFKTKKRKRIVSGVSLLIPLAAIVGLILSFVRFRADVEHLQFEHFKKDFEIKAQNKLFEANVILNNMVAQLENTAEELNKYKSFCHPDVQQILNFSSESSMFSFVGVANAEGKGYDSGGNNVDISTRQYFREAMQGEVAFSEVLNSKLFMGERVQIIAHPMRTDENIVRGVVFGVLNLEDVGVENWYSAHEERSSVYIIDSYGKYVLRFHNNRNIDTTGNFWLDMSGTSLTKEEWNHLKEEFDQQAEGEFSYSFGGESYYGCHIPIGPNKWQLVYSVSRDSTDQLIHSMYQLDGKNAMVASICYLVLLIYVVGHFKKANETIQKAHQEAQRNMEFMRISIEHSKHTVFEYDQTCRRIILKTNFKNQLFDCTTIENVPESMLQKNIIAPNSISAFEKLFETIKTQDSGEAEIQLTDENEKIWYRISMNNAYSDEQKIFTTTGLVEDISELKKQEEETKKKLQIQETLIAKALSYAKVNLNTGMIMEYNGKRVQMKYQTFLYQYACEKVGGEHAAYVEQKLALDTLRTAYQQSKESVEVQYLKQVDHKLRWVCCTVYRFYKDNSAEVLFVEQDIDEQKRKELALQKRAERDGLTDLYNAATTRLKINEVLSLPHDVEQNQVLVLIDLDNYKLINDTFGHDYGDQVLMDVAAILDQRFRSSDIVGRLGGDEFIVLLRDVKSYDYAEHMIKELCRAMCLTYKEGDQQVTISASIGSAVSPSDGNTFEELYKKADIAQYQIKKTNKNGYRRYYP